MYEEWDPVRVPFASRRVWVEKPDLNQGVKASTRLVGVESCMVERSSKQEVDLSDFEMVRSLGLIREEEKRRCRQSKRLKVE